MGLAPILVTEHPPRLKKSEQRPPPLPKPPKPWRPTLLLQLPIDVVILVIDELPLSCKHLLAQTCHPLRAILNNHYDLDPLELLDDRRQCRDFTFQIWKDDPTRYACECCSGAHDISYDDAPCDPAGVFRSSKKCAQDRQFWIYNQRVYPYIMQRHHIQLALKLTRLVGRLNLKEREYLGSLLRPLSHSNERGHTFHYAPKIVGGRYLLYKEYSWANDWWPQFAFICAHEMLSPPPRIYIRDLGPGEARFPCPYFGVPHALRLSGLSETPDLEIQGACQVCPTAFAIRGCIECGVLRVWQDLGRESPHNVDWGFVNDYFCDRLTVRPCDQVVWTRTLYESAEVGPPLDE